VKTIERHSKRFYLTNDTTTVYTIVAAIDFGVKLDKEGLRVVGVERSYDADFLLEYIEVVGEAEVTS